MRSKIRNVAGAALMTSVLAITACSGGGGGDEAESSALTVWTLESQPDRVETQKQLAADFTETSGTPVEIVAIDEAQYNQLLVSAAASGDLPDVVGGLSLPGVGALSANDLVDSEAATAVVEDLGRDTFVPRSLELATSGDELLAVPSDSWPSVLVYRKDLFDAAGLPAPTDYESIMNAASTLDSESMAGFVGFTSNQEAFEHFALANGCELADDSGEITLDSPECVEAFEFYNELISKYSVPGEQDPNSVRATYLSGGAAMAVFSSFILDEMAGLRADLMPTCTECAADPSYLAKNSGVVIAIDGPSGDTPGQYGKQTNWTIPIDADPAAQDFVSYMMTEAYEPWLAMAPEGKVPNRTGTTDEPNRFVDAWKAMPSGVDNPAPLSNFYAEAVIQELEESPETIQIWGIEQDQGALVGAMLGEEPVVQSLTAMLGGSLTPVDAASQAAEEVRSIKESLPE